MYRFRLNYLNPVTKNIQRKRACRIQILEICIAWQPHGLHNKIDRCYVPELLNEQRNPVHNHKSRGNLYFFKGGIEHFKTFEKYYEFYTLLKLNKRNF